MGPFAMLQDAALCAFMRLPGAGLQKLAVYHAVSRVRELRERGVRVSNASIATGLGIPASRVSEAMRWLRKHGLVVVDEHGPKAVKLEPVDLRECIVTGQSFTDDVTPQRNSSAPAEHADVTPQRNNYAPAYGNVTPERNADEGQKLRPSVIAPHRERDPCTDSSSSARDAVDLPSSEPVADEEEGDLGVDLDLWRQRVESRDIAVAAFDADPEAPWVEFRHRPAEAVLERFRQLGMRSERHTVPSFEGGKPRIVVRWRPSSEQAYRALPAMLEAIRDLFEPDPQDPIAAPETPPAPVAPVAVSVEPTDEEAAAVWEPIAAAFRGLDSHVDRAVPVSVDADVLSIRAADEMGELVLSKRAAELAARAQVAAIRVLPPEAQGAA